MIQVLFTVNMDCYYFFFIIFVYFCVSFFNNLNCFMAASSKLNKLIRINLSGGELNYLLSMILAIHHFIFKSCFTLLQELLLYLDCGDSLDP